MSNLGAILSTLAPSVGLGVIFYFVMRWVLRADRNERRHLSELDAQLDEAEKRAVQEAAVIVNAPSEPSTGR